MSHIPAKCTTPAKNPVTANSLAIIILSAGTGRKMKSRGAKALLPVGRTTLLENQLQTLWKVYAKSEIFVVTGFQAPKIRSICRGTYPTRLIYNSMYNNSNVMYGIALALESVLAKSVLILHGDIRFNTAAITDMVGESSKVYVLPESNKNINEDVGVVVQDNCVTNMSYGLPRVWGQMAYFTGKELSLFEKIAFNHEASSNWFFYEGINQVINNGGNFVAHSPANGQLLEINTVQDLRTVII
jgi:choline kinase